MKRNIKIMLVIALILICVGFAWNHNDRVHQIPIVKVATIEFPSTLSFSRTESSPACSMGWDGAISEMSLSTFMAKKKGDAYYYVGQSHIYLYTIEGNRFWVVDWKSNGPDIQSVVQTNTGLDIYEFQDGAYDWLPDAIAALSGAIAFILICIPSKSATYSSYGDFCGVA